MSGILEDVEHAFSGIREENHDQSPWALEWITEHAQDPQDLNLRMNILTEIHKINFRPSANDWAIDPVPDIDWLAHSYQQFPAFSVGPFYIYGSHCTDPVPTGQMGLQIDAATAFGSGEHGTTKGCLQAMLELKALGVCPWNILDMGTGSGILAIAAWKLWKTPIMAVDNDAECIRVTQRHCKSNAVPMAPSDVTCAVGDGFAAEIAQAKKPYELVIANILASVLKEMAVDLKSVLDENGYVILSGILIEQAQSVLDIYEPQGLVLKKRYDIGEWSTLVLHNPPA